MSREVDTQAPAPMALPGTEATGRDWPPEVAGLLGRVEALLQQQEVVQALDLLDRARSSSPWAVNARGVCLLRLGQAQRALELFRGLALGGFGLRPDAPLPFKTNYATAQLLSGDLTGCIVTLGQVRNEAHPAVQRLRAALRQWRQGLPFWSKVRWALGGEVDRPVTLGFSAGEL